MRIKTITYGRTFQSVKVEYSAEVEVGEKPAMVFEALKQLVTALAKEEVKSC